MTKYFKMLVVVLLLTILGLGLFTLFNQSFNWVVQIVPAKTVVDSCPATSEEAYHDYVMNMSKLLEEAHAWTRESGSYAQIAQAFKALELKHSGLEYPDCASELFVRIEKAFEYRALSYAAKAEGGLLANLKFYYYSTRASKKLVGIPYIIYKLDPPTPLPARYQRSA